MKWKNPSSGENINACGLHMAGIEYTIVLSNPWVKFLGQLPCCGIAMMSSLMVVMSPLMVMMTSLMRLL